MQGKWNRKILGLLGSVGALSLLLMQFSGCKLIEPESLAQPAKKAKASNASHKALVALGKKVLAAKTCTACHSTDGTRRVGPTFRGLFGSKRKVSTRGFRHTIVANAAYIRRSILTPKADIVVGYEKIPMVAPPVSKKEIDGVIAYLKSIGKAKLKSLAPAVKKTAKLAPIPPLSSAERKMATKIFFDRCAGCHGVLRKGATGPNLQPHRTRKYGTATLKTFITYGLPGGMPGWGKAGILSPKEIDVVARFLQHKPPAPPEFALKGMQKSWKLLVPVSKRPTKPQHKRNWKNFFGVVLRDAGKVAIIDGDTKKLITVVKTGFAVHILRSSASGRYFYSIGRDGKVTMIDLWMKIPKVVAEVKVCYDARSVDSSKYKGPRGDFMDKLLVVGCYWPPSVVIMDGQSLKPKKILSTSGYTFDTNVFLREARAAAIIASHYAPEWIINIKETGFIWVLDYSDLNNLKVTSIAADRFLHDGGFDMSHRYALMAANARHKIAVIDTKNKKLIALVKVGKIPHPGRGANYKHPKFGPLWCTGHLGDNTIQCIGTDPKDHPRYAWKVVAKMVMPKAGGGNLFVKTHPNSKWIWADRTLHPKRKIYRSIFVFDRNTFKLVKTLELPKQFPGRAVHMEYNRAGSEVFVSAWGPKNKISALIVYDDKTLKVKKIISGAWMITPTGKWNVFNTMKDIY